MPTSSVLEYSENSSIIGSPEGEKRWISQIHKILDHEVKIPFEPVSIFRVPASLSIYKPEAYAPQLVALGPYHHFRRNLYEMERIKLVAARKLQGEIKTFEFEQLVKALNELEYQVRACYHKYLDMEGETLVWIMAIDGLFLLDFVDDYNKSPLTTMTQVIDPIGNKLAYGSILGDVMMLENQIPIVILDKIWSIQRPAHSEVAANDLHQMLLNFVESFSPIKIKKDPTLFEVPKPRDPHHLLDLLYKLLVPNSNNPTHATDHTKDQTEAPNPNEKMSFINTRTVSHEVFPRIWDITSKFQLKSIKRITAPVNVLISLVSNVSGVYKVLSNKDKETGKPENERPEVEEINIPSVTNLSKYNVKFCPSNGGIETVGFDLRTHTLTLPVITLDVHSEVVMRNLVAYEASIAPESLVFTRYMELMHGIIDTAEDARILKRKKVIVSKLKTDAEVAEMFNGMSKSVKITSVPHIDNTIKNVNTFYNTMKTVRIFRRLRKFLYHSWKLLTLIAVALLLVMMGLQSFCSVYVCSKVFGTIASTE